MKMSSIHSLQSSTTSHKLLESVRSLRPLLCEALRASGCDTIDINEQEPALHGEGVQNEDVPQYLNSHVSGQHHDMIYAQCLHVKELANVHAISSYGGHIHDHEVNAEYNDHILHMDPQLQHRNQEPQAHNCANDGDAVVPFADVHHHNYHDAHHHGHGKYSNAEYGHYGNVYPRKEFDHHCDAIHHGYGHRGEGHLHHGDPHHHEHGCYSNSIIVSTDNFPGVQEQFVQNKRFRHSFPMTRESSVNVDPHTPLSFTQYPQADCHLLDHQHIHAYHNRHLQQQYISSETMAFLNTVLLEAPASLNEGSISNEALIGAEASNKSNNNNECIRAQESSCSYSMNNVEAFAGHLANSREVPPLLKSPKTMSQQLESSGESEGTDDEEDGKLLSPKGKANLFSERRRNEALYALRALVPTVDKLSYLHQLRDKVDDLQNDICSLQTEKGYSAPNEEGFSTCPCQEMEIGKDSARHTILELDVLVVDMEQKTYHLCIRCEREGLLKLTKALEALNFDMLNANIAVTRENQIMYTVVVKVDTVEVLTPEMLKESILRSAIGFHL